MLAKMCIAFCLTTDLQLPFKDPLCWRGSNLSYMACSWVAEQARHKQNLAAPASLDSPKETTTNKLHQANPMKFYKKYWPFSHGPMDILMCAPWNFAILSFFPCMQTKTTCCPVAGTQAYSWQVWKRSNTTLMHGANCMLLRFARLAWGTSWICNEDKGRKRHKMDRKFVTFLHGSAKKNMSTFFHIILSIESRFMLAKMCFAFCLTTDLQLPSKDPLCWRVSNLSYMACSCVAEHARHKQNLAAPASLDSPKETTTNKLPQENPMKFYKKYWPFSHGPMDILMCALWNFAILSFFPCMQTKTTCCPVAGTQAYSWQVWKRSNTTLMHGANCMLLRFARLAWGSSWICNGDKGGKRHKMDRKFVTFLHGSAKKNMSTFFHIILSIESRFMLAKMCFAFCLTTDLQLPSKDPRWRVSDLSYMACSWVAEQARHKQNLAAPASLDSPKETTTNKLPQENPMKFYKKYWPFSHGPMDILMCEPHAALWRVHRHIPAHVGVPICPSWVNTKE